MMTKANIVTLTRIALVPIFMWAMILDTDHTKTLALVIFILASTTDWVDGFLARRFNEVTTFGKFMDPLADKLLITAAMLIFVQQGRLPSWAAMLIIAREFIVTSLRSVASAQGAVLSAELSGKIKTVVQIFCTSYLLIPVQIFSDFRLGEISGEALAGYVMVAVTLWSGIDYLVRHRHILKKTG